MARQARQSRPQLVWFWQTIAARWLAKRPRPPPRESARCSWSASRGTGRARPLVLQVALDSLRPRGCDRPPLRDDPGPQDRSRPGVHRRPRRPDRHHRRAGADPDAAEALYAGPPAASRARRASAAAGALVLRWRTQRRLRPAARRRGNQGPEPGRRTGGHRRGGRLRRQRASRREDAPRIASPECYVHIDNAQSLAAFIASVGSSGASRAADVARVIKQIQG